MNEMIEVDAITHHRPINEFTFWLRNGKRGSSFTYCVGELARECELNPKSDLVKIRQIAYEAWRANMLCLVSRPRGFIGRSKRIRSFDYIAVKR